MPLIAYSCESCEAVVKKFVRMAKDAAVSLICEKCGKNMKKMLSAPASTSKITVDNGVQARAVEIHPDIVTINEERANKDYRKD